MIKCTLCGKRTWGDLVLVPEKGRYHYNCAKSLGLLPSLEEIRDTITKRSEEITRLVRLLEQMRVNGADRAECHQKLELLNNEVRQLSYDQEVLVKRRWERNQENKGD